MLKFREYQKEKIAEAVDILSSYGIVYMACEVRTGKTLMSLEVAKRMGAKNVLFITKKKAIGSIQADCELLAPSYKLHVINYESVHKLPKVNFDFAIIDEAHNLGAYPKPSQRTINIQKIVYDLPIVYLSGTPTPESYSQLFHQLWISGRSPFIAYGSKKRAFYRFADSFINVTQRMINGYQVRDYTKADKKKIDALTSKYFVRLSQIEAGFEAPVVEEVMYVALNEQVQKYYLDMKMDKIIQTHDGHVATASNGADVLNKLRQLSSGHIIFDEEPTAKIYDFNKALFIKHNFSNKKIAIFYVYKAELIILKQIFKNWTESPEDFNAADKLIFLGQVKSASEGVNLRTADVLIMYNISFSATNYWQSRARIQSKERQGSAPLYWIFSDHGIERDVYEAVQKKKNFTYGYYKASIEKARGLYKPIIK